MDEFIPLSSGEKLAKTSELTICGYPCLGHNFEPSFEGMKAYQFGLTKVGAIHEVKAQSAELIHKISTFSGQSGAPVILNR